MKKYTRMVLDEYMFIFGLLLDKSNIGGGNGKENRYLDVPFSRRCRHKS